MGHIKKLTEEHYRIGFRTGIGIASIFWLVILLVLSYYAKVEMDAIIEQCETLLNKCYESK
ncbi:hypothetical protein QO206_03240 [Leeuwenhoekiella aequorea]|uniref:hypothetical protein n=1 Tax=Leeuwenhoekiella aequorea TaxID=283736 RepID=UPI00352FCBA4|tara:strand:+ start:7544 stop:7726 length:183 start_codon:yes stop_codon:yes gene_type:complete